MIADEINNDGTTRTQAVTIKFEGLASVKMPGWTAAQVGVNKNDIPFAVTTLQVTSAVAGSKGVRNLFLFSTDLKSSQIFFCRVIFCIRYTAILDANQGG